MPGLVDELRKLGKLKRTRANFDTVAAQVAELKEHAESASTALDALTELREKAEELQGALGEAGDDNPLVQWSTSVNDAITDLLAALPGDEGDNISELVEEADGACDTYESAQDDRDYSAADREEAWGALLDSLENVANAIEVKEVPVND